MNMLMMFAIVTGGLILALAIIGSTILIVAKIIKGGASPKGQRTETEETRMIQAIYQGLSRMEERIEALETIILDQKRKDRIS
jgi:phage shock protein B